MIEVRETARFAAWFRELRDLRAKSRINTRIRRISLGNFGDVEPVGEGVSELRIHHGPGYRVYFVRRGATVVILLCGGDKASQQRDIRAARDMAKELN
ncbi:MAG: type II toxin-antitoxin system RelE/ParE family toxin [Pseudomonadota bacterium]|nr:type II toxin-antitoxin system RelE/ParE family toxin [Pseudomonadota bacterium]